MEENEIIAMRLRKDLDKFYQLVYALNKRVLAWENYLQILESPELLKRFNRKWNSYIKAKELGYLLFQNVQRFEEARTRIMEFLSINNPRLGQKIANFKPLQENLNFQLSNLLTILNKNKALAISYVKTHSKELIAWADSLKNEKDKDEIRRLIIEISGDLLNEFNKCIVDIQRWKDFRVGRNIQFFHHRVIVYLLGGMLENENFLGLVRYFKDKSFVSEIKKSQTLKMLLTYQKQINFFATQRAIVYASISRKGWEGFRGKDGFFNNLIKGRNYIETVAETFGNKDVANRLETMYATTGEYPEGWVRNLDSILERITHPLYQNIYVIIPAANDLIQIFEKRRKELEVVDINSKLDKLLYILTKSFHESIKKSRNLSIYQSILDLELRLLRREIKEEKMVFKDLLSNSGYEIINFVEASFNVIKSREENIHKKIVAFISLKLSQLNVIRNMTKVSTINDETSYAVSLYSFFFKNEKRISDIEIWVGAIKDSGLDSFRYALQEIESALKREIELRNLSGIIDKQLKIIKNNYFILNKNGRKLSITNSGYLGSDKNINTDDDIKM